MSKKHDTLKQIRLWSVTLEELRDYKAHHGQKYAKLLPGDVPDLSLNFLSNALIRYAIRTLTKP